MTSKPAPGTVGAFIKSPEFAFKAIFNGLQPGTDAFTSVWKKMALDQPQAFKESQHAFIKRTHFDILVARIKTINNLDVPTRSFALQDVIWSTAVQHGPNTSLVSKAISTIEVPKSDPTFDKKLIRGIYAERGKKNGAGLALFPKVSVAVAKSLIKRFNQEEIDALKMLEEELKVKN